MSAVASIARRPTQNLISSRCDLRCSVLADATGLLSATDEMAGRGPNFSEGTVVAPPLFYSTTAAWGKFVSKVGIHSALRVLESAVAISTAPEHASDAVTRQMLAGADTAATLTGLIVAAGCQLRAVTCSGC